MSKFRKNLGLNLTFATIFGLFVGATLYSITQDLTLSIASGAGGVVFMFLRFVFEEPSTVGRYRSSRRK